MKRYFVTFFDCNKLNMAQYEVYTMSFHEAAQKGEYLLQEVDGKFLHHVFSVEVLFDRVV